MYDTVLVIRLKIYDSMIYNIPTITNVPLRLTFFAICFGIQIKKKGFIIKYMMGVDIKPCSIIGSKFPGTLSSCVIGIAPDIIIIRISKMVNVKKGTR